MMWCSEGLVESGLPLTLFVAWVFANNTNNAFPADNPAGFTKFFYGRSDFHIGKRRKDWPWKAVWRFYGALKL